MNADGFHHAPYPVHDGTVKAQDNLLLRMVLGNQRDHFAFGKDGANTADAYFPPRPQRQFPHFFQRDLEFGCHHLQETSRPGGTLVIHGEVQDPAALSDADDLGILSANVNHRSDVGKEMIGPKGVARNLGHSFLGKGDGDSAVAGGHDSKNPGTRDACFGHNAFERLFGRLRAIGPGLHDAVTFQPAIGVHDDRIRAERAYVDAREIIHSVHPHASADQRPKLYPIFTDPWSRKKPQDACEPAPRNRPASR